MKHYAGDMKPNTFSPFNNGAPYPLTDNCNVYLNEHNHGTPAFVNVIAAVLTDLRRLFSCECLHLAVLSHF